jgi:N-acetylmuramoyl-L-alanine amidase
VNVHAHNTESVKGASVLIPKAGYITDKNLISESKTVGTYILKDLIGSTGAISRGLSPRDDMTGFNWSKVPVVLVEVGFLSNPHEDEMINTDDYQNKIAAGIVNGINKYLRIKIAGRYLF